MTRLIDRAQNDLKQCWRAVKHKLNNNNNNKSNDRHSMQESFSTGPGSSVVECPLQGTGGHGFDPRPRHTKVLSAPRLTLRLTG